MFMLITRFSHCTPSSCGVAGRVAASLAAFHVAKRDRSMASTSATLSGGSARFDTASAHPHLPSPASIARPTTPPPTITTSASLVVCA